MFKVTIMRFLVLIVVLLLSGVPVSHAQNKERPPVVMKPLRFIGETFQGPINNEQVDRLLESDIYLRENNVDGLLLNGPDGDTVTVSSCDSYFSYNNKGYDISYTNVSISIKSFFTQTCDPLSFFKKNLCLHKTPSLIHGINQKLLIFYLPIFGKKHE